MKLLIAVLGLLASAFILAACDTGGTAAITPTPTVNVVTAPTTPLGGDNTGVATPTRDVLPTLTVGSVETPTVLMAQTPTVNMAETPTEVMANTPTVNMFETPTVLMANTPTVSMVETPTIDLAAPTATISPTSQSSAGSGDSTVVPPSDVPSDDSTTLLPVTVAVAPQYANFRPGSRINLPAGFSISVYAAGLNKPRMMAIAPNGDLFVANMNAGQVVALRDANADGFSDNLNVYASGLNGPHSLVFNQGYLYVATNDKVVRYQYNSGDLQAQGAAQIVTNDVPVGGRHGSRTIAIGSDGKLYLSAGSSCDTCEEEDDRRAAISVFDLDANSGQATNRRVYARGLRNAVGITFQPGTNNLWGVVNGRDNLGDNIPPEILVQIKDGKDYGWPYCYGDRVYDRSFGLKSPAYCENVELPDLKMQAHSAPLGLDFYTGKQFPANYSGNIFIGFHGSWNRTTATGYKLVRVPMVGGKPQAAVDFATGWLQNGRWGRPVAPLTAPDGSVFLSDDGAGVVYRIYYTGR